MEELLNESESSSLDFKRDQYAFEHATDEQKGELLKDVLAFTNAWRRTDAYILIGIEEVKGARSSVVGITSHFDDAKIQQFVNSKTNRPVTFSYKTTTFEGVQIGIFHIPIQDRPIYINKKFGNLEANKVYIRRGSSTDFASPDEIAKIGSVKVREFIGDLSRQASINPVFEAIRSEKDAENTVIVEFVVHNFQRSKHLCRIVELNELYACFMEEGVKRSYYYPIDQIKVSFDLDVQKKMFIIYHSQLH